MDTIMIILWILLVFLNGMLAASRFEEGCWGYGFLNTITAILWGACIILKYKAK